MLDYHNLSIEVDERHRYNLRITYLIFVMSTVILIQFILMGSFDYFSNGVNIVVDSIKGISIVNDIVSANVIQLESDGRSLEYEMVLSSNSSCNISPLTQALDHYYFSFIQDITVNLIDAILFSNIIRTLDFYANQIRINIIWGLYIFLMSIPITYSVFLYLEYKNAIKCFIGFVIIILFLLFILCGIEFILMVIYYF